MAWIEHEGALINLDKITYIKRYKESEISFFGPGEIDYTRLSFSDTEAADKALQAIRKLLYPLKV